MKRLPLTIMEERKNWRDIQKNRADNYQIKKVDIHTS